MVAIPGLPNKSLLPLNKIISIGGVSCHSTWLGGDPTDENGGSPGRYFPRFGDARYGFAFKNWNYYLAGHDPAFPFPDPPHFVDYSPDAYYVCAPPRAVTARDLFAEMVNGKWKFFSPNGTDGWINHVDIPTNINLLEDYAVFAEPLTFRWWQEPFGQHIVMARMTNTVMAGGRPPLWSVFDNAERDSSATQIAHHSAWSTLCIVIDGTGSSGSGTIANGHLDRLIPDLIAAGHSSVRLVVVKFSDYPDVTNDTTDSDDIPALLLGTFNGINSGTAAAITALNAAHDTGNGGDANESQFEGIHLAITTAVDKGWANGTIGIVVYTDAASVCVMPASDEVALRLIQRDDGRGVHAHPRLDHPMSMPNRPTSVQQPNAPRQPQIKNTYS